MKRAIVTSLLALFALSSCETAHNAAVATFRVVDAPHVYMRRKLGLDQEQPPTSTTTTTTTQTAGVYSDTGPNPTPQPYPASQRYSGSQPNSTQQPPPPPSSAQTQRQVVTTERQPPAQTQVQPTATPRVVRQESAPPPSSSPAPVAASSQNGDLPYAKPVPGKPGYVFSPFDKNGGYVDVTGYSPGQKVKDPYSGRIFLVP
jgi:hypothetical protein